MSIRFFTILSSILAQPALELAYCDFESAAIIAAGNIFRQVRVQGCFFHLRQAVYRKPLQAWISDTKKAGTTAPPPLLPLRRQVTLGSLKRMH
ncbi:hypothetical protein HPB48_026880 [Haemaphysalis longicornis]|uniref:MULE transposase domain-containing protein n=1 Tax=Haemaphysalis longicornis TaxID=44386 RepID=A0A9J6HDF9_HAELO|nr:hypothetical protein HPB48_026880 [Haemaphysalis longicornis]